MSKLPAQYQAFKDVFSRDAAMKLPPSRPGHDLEIQLKGGSQPPYKRSATTLQANEKTMQSGSG
jgi:hypothetical protein